MRAVFGVLSLVVALAVVGVLVKKSWQSSQESLARQSPSLPAGHNQGSEAKAVREQSRQSEQIQQQYRQQLESALNAPRPAPDQAP
ncbi:hypothetical protein KUF54_04655 [Comamonas sp. Y33R10-2]|uniref:hypothetical protein n=1 Tax=Comamonas sp. Y33R10-2 TaxID=2853257 RepID=UPI001C5C92BD|nr:hypothetical protein [Comamonas sp. Y33R10-2]QXZ10518.1 hypothetical protein KUF54_04655 [Comamonas sp. Y33R10-2]